MKKPDAVFTITVNPVFRVISCAEKQGQEERGLIGFHAFTTCPNCKVIPDGFEFWGENGHRQGSAADRPRMIAWIASKAKQQWRRQAGGVIGYRFQTGSAIHYRA